MVSPDPDGSTWPNPGTATQRYSRMCARLGYSMHLHQLRHYSATELISGGVDVPYRGWSPRARGRGSDDPAG